MTKTKYKTPEYLRRAQKNYNEKHDNILIHLPKGYKEIIRQKTDLSFNKYVSALIEADLNAKTR